MTASDSLPADNSFPRFTGYRAPSLPTTTPHDGISQIVEPGRASPVPAATVDTFHAPYAGEFLGTCISRSSVPSMAFTVISAARLSLHPHPYGRGPLTTPQASRHAADRIFAPPCRAFDAGLRPHPFPGEAASLLPGHLAATRTGLPPASDDELTNNKSPTQGNLLFCWTHENARRDRRVLW